MEKPWYTEHEKRRRYGASGRCILPGKEGENKMKKSVKKKVLPILLLSAFVTLVMTYDEKERILEN